MNGCRIISLLGLLICSRADALFGVGMLNCKFTSPDDVVFLTQVFYNKVLWGEYNSTLGKFVGYTETAREIAEELNKFPFLLKNAQKNVEKCKSNVPFLMELLSKPVAPTVKLRSITATDSEHSHTFVCSVYNYYPPQIRVTWLRNGTHVASNVTSSEELPSGNWLYQIHSHLELEPTSGDKIACMVEHSSFQKPMVYEWVRDLTSEDDKTKIAVGVSGFALGAVVLGAGLIYYLKSPTGRESVQTIPPAEDEPNEEE
ncbi:H-2 class II histocompatibility antigen, E-S beta chain-like [Cheilinus undulatus]|uniref:H-2 class II histocompatibility antigen, E-S beta chain-like n=1 Tax=Cheilinus undulatus TaxID=241271 RepID=UPI001BD54B9B|nr:H-2 class II histocompatibility antigen, E-S beta chain-like [Cheilinus undulatus]